MSNQGGPSDRNPDDPHTGYPFLNTPLPLAFAHRGGAADGDENTVAAFERAVTLGYRYVETDVQATADGVPVIFHDADLRRVAGLDAKIGALRAVDLASIRVGGAQAVPQLAEVLTAWPTLRFNLDVKSWAAVGPLIDTLRRTDVLDRVLVASFSGRRLVALRREFGPRLATSMGPAEVARLRLAAVAGRSMLGLAPGVPAVQVPVRYGPVPVVDRRFVGYAHRMGVQVHVWTIDEPSEINRLLDLGVDGIMTDRIDVLREVLLSRGQWET